MFASMYKRRRVIFPNAATQREACLSNTRLDGASWENDTGVLLDVFLEGPRMLFALCPRTNANARNKEWGEEGLLSREASVKRGTVEQGRSDSVSCSGGESQLLALDRPDLTFAPKESCRFRAPYKALC